MMRHAEFEDPRLVEVYDATCPWSRDDDFFVAVVAEGGPARRVLDLGCGTGRLALGLAAAGHTVTGVDPARASLDAARAKPGGRLVFDTRDPADRAWERWPEEWHRTVVLPSGGSVEQSIEVTDVDGDVVTHDIHYRFDPGDQLVSTATLRFRTEDELRSSLGAAGFTIEQIHGGWKRESVGGGDGELLVMARRAPK